MKLAYYLQFILLTLCCVNWSCKDDPGDPLPYSELLAFDIMEGFYYPLFPGDTIDIHYFLTDRKGRLIADTVPANGSIVRMYGSFNPDETYDFTRVEKSEYNGLLTYYIGTFLDVKPHTYTISRQNSINYDIEYVITNITNPLTDFSSISEYQYAWHVDHAILTLTLRNNPDIIYESFRQEGNPEIRYLYREQVVPGTRDTIDYTDLPIIDAPLHCSFPVNSLLESNVYGLKNEIPGRLFPIDSYDEQVGSMTGSYHVPENVFDRFKFSTSWYSNGKLYQYDKILPSIPDEVNTPDLSFNIESYDPLDFRMSSSSSYDVFQILFNDLDTAENYLVLWSVFGEGNAFTQFEIPYLPQMFSPTHSFSPNDLRFEFGKIERLEGLGDYHEQLQYYIGFLAIPDDLITIFESMRQH